MPLRRSPALTPAALLARRLNSLKSTGPRTARGKAWSCLNALRHGQRSRRRTFRDKLCRTGDAEAVYLFDFIFEELLRDHEHPSEFVFRRLESLAVRAWCIESGRRARKVAKTSLRTKLESGMPIARYAANYMVPRRLKITNKAGWGFMLINPVPSRRRRVRYGWVPEVEDLEGTPPKARRVREGCKPGTEIVRSVPSQCPEWPPVPFGDALEVKRSGWDAIRETAGRIGSSILGRLGWRSSSAVARASRPRPATDAPGTGALQGRRPTPDWLLEDPEDYESESPEEFLFRHKFLAKIALWAARRC